MSETMPSFWQSWMPTYARWFGIVPSYRTALSASELPDPIKQTIKSVVKRTRLWSKEKYYLAQELIAHFQDGLEAGHSTEELISDFGNPHVAAKLIRKAKRRCRPIWWQAWWYVTRGLAVFACWYIIVAVWQSFGHPSISTDYLALMNQKAEAVPQEQRAWPLYRNAITELDIQHLPKAYSADDFDFYYSTSTLATFSIWKQAKYWLKSKEHAIELIREASKRPNLGFPMHYQTTSYSPEDRAVFSEYWSKDEKLAKKYDQTIPQTKDEKENNSFVSIPIPHITYFRHMSYVLVSDVAYSLELHDGTRALADVETILRMSKHCEESPLLVCELVGSALQSMAFMSVRKVLDEEPSLWTDAQLQELAHTIAACKLDFKQSYKTERYFFDDSVQRIYSDNGNGNGRLTIEGLDFLTRGLSSPKQNNRFRILEGKTLGVRTIQSAALPAMNAFAASRKESIDRYDLIVNHFVKQLDEPLWKEGDPVIDQMLTNDSRWNKMRFMLVNLVVPSYEYLRYAWEKNQARREGTLIGIALELYHRKHNAWPQSLDELSPELLPKIPVDRINGTPLCYRIVNDRPIVYSKGIDGDDDDGTPPVKEKDLSEPDEKGEQHEVTKTYEEWDEYQVRPPVKKTDDPKNVTNGDWIIWTLLPEHRAKPEKINKP